MLYHDTVLTSTHATQIQRGRGWCYWWLVLSIDITVGFSWQWTSWVCCTYVMSTLVIWSYYVNGERCTPIFLFLLRTWIVILIYINITWCLLQYIQGKVKMSFGITSNGPIWWQFMYIFCNNKDLQRFDWCKECKLFWGVQSTIAINSGNCWTVTKSTLNFFVTKLTMVALWSNSQNHAKENSKDWEKR